MTEKRGSPYEAVIVRYRPTVCMKPFAVHYFFARDAIEAVSKAYPYPEMKRVPGTSVLLVIGPYPWIEVAKDTAKA